MASSATSKLKSLDFYRKIDRELTKASLSGAGFSVFAAVAMVFLFVTELRNFLAVTTTTNVVVDKSQDGEFLRINFNLSLPALSCEFASVDVSDVLGTHRFNLTKTVRKIPIDANLRPIGGMLGSDPIPTPSNLEVEEFHDGEVAAFILTDGNFERTAKEYPILVVNFYAPWCQWCQRLEPAWEKASSIVREKYPPESVGSIRMAKTDCTVERELCKKHHIQAYPSIRIFRKGSDVKSAQGHHDHESYYGDRDTDSLVAFAELLLENQVAAEQPRVLAIDDKSEKNTRPAPPSGGCNIEGFVLVKKVPGNLMVSAHSGAHSFDASSMNMTHIVHHLSFGHRLGRRKLQQVERLKKHFAEEKDLLTGRSFVSQHSNVTHDHHLQAVLTTVEPLGSREILFSYDYTAHSNILQSPNVPVLKFHYELSPMQVVITENRRSFAHFLTQLCAIIGGVFTVVGILDSMFHNAVRVMKKTELGKQF